MADILWKQRLQNFSKAFEQLEKFMQKDSLNEFEEQGLIQCFEYNYELSWNVIKDFYEYQGETNIQGSKDAFRLAFKRGLVKNGEVWMDMVQNRALTTHTYNKATADEITKAIRDDYYPAFKDLIKKLREQDS